MITKRNKVTGSIVSDYPDTDTTQYCPSCSTNKTFDNFYKDKRGANGLTRRCKNCWVKKSYSSRTRSVESIEKHYAKKMLNDYGITREEYDVMAVAQNYKCKICKNVNRSHARLVIDHDHTTGRIRGLLCGQCNSALGLLKDDIGLLEAAILYLGYEGGIC